MKQILSGIHPGMRRRVSVGNPDYTRNPRLNATYYEKRRDEKNYLYSCESYPFCLMSGKFQGIKIRTSNKKLFAGISLESDGGGMKTEQKIVGKHMNCLSTMTLDLHRHHGVALNRGPETNLYGVSDTPMNIFYPVGNVAIFKNAIESKDAYSLPKNKI